MFNVTSNISRLPLILDHEHKTARVATFELGRFGKLPSASLRQGELICIDPDTGAPNGGGKSIANLVRIQYPCDKKEVLIADCPNAAPITDERGLHLIGKEWWLLDETTGKFRTITRNVPWDFHGLYNSPDETALAGSNMNVKARIVGVHASSAFGPLVFTVKYKTKGSDGNVLPPEHRCWRLKPELLNSVP